MSQQDSEKTTIDGLEFTIFMLDPWIANDITHAISKIVGPSLGELAGAVMGSKDKQGEAKKLLDKKLDPEFAAKGVTELFRNMDASTTRWVMQELAKVTTVTGQGKLSDTFSAVFQGKIGTMYAWLGWALKVQLQSVFGTLSTAIEFYVQRTDLAE
jgi:hypothetical protein